MVKLKSNDASSEVLDAVFAALSDATRRDVLAVLDGGEFGLTGFAQSHGMSLPALMKHLRVLENAGLIERTKEGRVVRCALSAGPLQEAALWLSRYEKFWSGQLDALGRYLYHQQEVSPWPSQSPEQAPPALRPPSASRATTTSRRKPSGAPGRTRKR